MRGLASLLECWAVAERHAGRSLDQDDVIGAYRLSDHLAIGITTVVVVCPPCGRRGVYDVARLIARYGDIVGSHLLTLVSPDCPSRRASSGRCGIVFETPFTREEEAEIKRRRR